MKKLFLVLCLLLMCASARATTITVSSYAAPSNWQFGTPAVLRIYVNSQFVDSDGVVHMAQATGGPNFFQSLTCTVSAGIITIPSFTIASTIDSPTNPNATYTFIWYDKNGVRKDTFAASIKVPVILGTTITWGNLLVYNSAHPNPPGPQFPDIQQVRALINNAGTLTPGGSNTYIQFNNAGILGGSSLFTFDALNDLATPAFNARHDGVLFMNTGLALAPDGSSQSGVVNGIVIGQSGVAMSFLSGGPVQGASTAKGLTTRLWASDALAGTSVNGAQPGGEVQIYAGDAARRNTGNANGANVIILAGGGVGTGVSGNIGLGIMAPTTFVHIANVSPELTIQDTGASGFSQIGRVRFTDSAATQRFSLGLVGDGSGDASFKLSNDKLLRFYANDVEVMRVGSPTAAGAGTGVTITGNLRFTGGVIADSPTAPTLSGFGTSPSVTNHNGSVAFLINVGTGGTASTGTINLSPNATIGWGCTLQDLTNPNSFVTSMTGYTASSVIVRNYSRTTGLPIAWTASDVLFVMCRGF